MTNPRCKAPQALEDTDAFAAVRRSIREACDKAEDAPSDRQGEGWAGRIGGFCPVQGNGSVGNYFWYFRARHDAWSFEIYSESCEGDLPATGPIWFVDGEYDDASWMPFSEAWKRIEESIVKWELRGDQPQAGEDK